MTGVVSPESATPPTITTTLFDLMSAMQQRALTPLHEALIVPTVASWLHSDRLRWEGRLASRSVASVGRGGAGDRLD